MVYILHIETSENICSTALSEDDKLIAFFESNTEKSHSQILTSLIYKLFEQTNIAISNLHAVAVSTGPGSYTGLRIGVSVAKGICYGRKIPLIAINTLEILCHAAKNSFQFAQGNEANGSTLLVPMIDARRMEVYQQYFNLNYESISDVTSEVISSTSYNDLLKFNQLYFFGSGADKIVNIISHENAIFLRNIRPHAKYMINSAFRAYNNQIFANLAYYEPFYLKSFKATQAKKNLLYR